MSSPVERLKHPRPSKPTLETDWVLIDAVKLESIQSKFRGICIPLTLANAQAGCDGTSFELAVGDYFSNARIGWWCDMPKEWQELVPVVTELERLSVYTPASCRTAFDHGRDRYRTATAALERYTSGSADRTSASAGLQRTP